MDVCVKDPGFTVDAVFRGNIADFVAVYLGHVPWRSMAGTALLIEADPQMQDEFLLGCGWTKCRAATFPRCSPPPMACTHSPAEGRLLSETPVRPNADQSATGSRHVS